MNKEKDSCHVRIRNIDFNYFAGWRCLVVAYPDGRDEIFHKYSKEQANEKVGKILEKEPNRA
jgi:hypothetical protein|tara:strand:- start:7 stop:192 length:186 start_codon:yes stop_codon:yes gene_type:complete